MDKRRYIFIVLLILLIIIPFSFSVPPVTQTFVGDTGLEIEYPKILYHEINTEYVPHFHIFNLSNGYNYRDGDTINCTIHVYNYIGRQIYINSTNTWHDMFDIEFIIPSSVFSYNGEYSYIMQCENGGAIGGFTSTSFTVNETGTETENNIISIILIYILLGGFYFVFGKLNQDKIKMDSTKVATWLTLLSYSMIIFKGISLSYFAVASYMNYNISSLLNVIFISDLIVLSGISILTIIFAVLGYMNPDLNNGKWEPRKW